MISRRGVFGGLFIPTQLQQLPDRGFTIDTLEPTELLRIENNNVMIFSIAPDGKVTFGDGFTTIDAASREFVEALGPALRATLLKCNSL